MAASGNGLCTADAGLANVHAEFEQLAMNPRRSPCWVLSAHLADQNAHLYGDRGPSGWPLRTLQVQKRLKPFRCQAITDSGLTRRMADRQSAQIPDSQAQRNRSNMINFGLFTERRKTLSWCRSAWFSNCRAARVLKMDDRPANRVSSTPSVAVWR
jgi:hypothetical protein